MEDRRVNKIKINKDNKVMITWEKKMGESYDEYSLNCSEPARPELYAAIQNLAIHVIEMCELPEEYISRIKVKGVSFSYSEKKETMGAVITAIMDLKYSFQPLNLNTPHKTVDFPNDGNGAEEMLLSGKCIDVLDTVVKEAFKYIDGDRAQQKLFDEENKSA